MSENTMTASEASVEAFVDAVEHPARRADARTLLDLMGRATGLAPRLWGTSLIGYGEYHYRYDSGREGDFFLVGFSPRKQNLSIYIMPGFEAYDDLLAKLGKHKIGKSCLYVNTLADVDMDVLEELVRASFAHMKATHNA